MFIFFLSGNLHPLGWTINDKKLLNACFSQITEFQKPVLESPNHKFGVDIFKSSPSFAWGYLLKKTWCNRI
ncbi:MAG: hypothetical protein DRR19_05150 [Candidatus Parabeggiatoa sp. nov. 1]|nr:MAG: hypothetical protein DRR19_05150 [Gammaproteobacteria bacterium]